MSIMTLAVPVVAVVTAAVFLDEPIVGTQVLGMAVVLLALGMVVVRTSRAPVPMPDVDPEAIVAGFSHRATAIRTLDADRHE
jgi:presenilin-like A22 family membrane protease